MKHQPLYCQSRGSLSPDLIALSGAEQQSLLGLVALTIVLCPLCLQELSQWRKQQQEQALRNSVLDEEAAAKFSAAAAIAAKAREKKEKGHLYGDSKLLAAADDDVAVVDTILEVCRLVLPGTVGARGKLTRRYSALTVPCSRAALACQR